MKDTPQKEEKWFRKMMWFKNHSYLRISSIKIRPKILKRGREKKEKIKGLEERKWIWDPRNSDCEQEE